MNKPTVAVIGAGMAGLFTALYLLERGYQVVIFEKSNRVGGRLRFIEYGPYRIDGGPTMILLPQLIEEEMRKLGVRLPAPIQRLDPLSVFYFAETDETFYKWFDKDRLDQELRRFDPVGTERFHAWYKTWAPLFSQAKTKILEKEQSMSYILQNMPYFIVLFMRTNAYRSWQNMSVSLFNHPGLRQAYQVPSLYVGGHSAQMSALQMMIPLVEHLYGVGYLPGGYAGLAQCVYERLKAEGVELHLNTTVLDWQGRAGRVTHLVTDGGTVAVDAVVNSSERWILTREVSQRKWQPSAAAIVYVLGLKTRLTDWPIHYFYLPGNYEQWQERIFIKGHLSLQAPFYVFYPSSIDRTLAPLGHSVMYIMVPVPPLTGQESIGYAPGLSVGAAKTSVEEQQARYTQYAESLLPEILKQIAPRIDQQRVWQETILPTSPIAQDWYLGGSFGIAPHWRQFGPLRPAVHHQHWANVFQAGASTQPGGGIPIVLLGARIAAKKVGEIL